MACGKSSGGTGGIEEDEVAHKFWSSLQANVLALYRYITSVHPFRFCKEVPLQVFL